MSGKGWGIVFSLSFKFKYVTVREVGGAWVGRVGVERRGDRVWV